LPTRNAPAFLTKVSKFYQRLSQILGTVTHSTNNRDYGHVLFGSTDPEKAENVAAKLVTEGFAKVRDNCNDAALKEAQEGAKNAGKGIWSSEPASAHIRKVLWDYENPRQLVSTLFHFFAFVFDVPAQQTITYIPSKPCKPVLNISDCPLICETFYGLNFQV